MDRKMVPGVGDKPRLRMVAPHVYDIETSIAPGVRLVRGPARRRWWKRRPR